jgi:hypothetical protein
VAKPGGIQSQIDRPERGQPEGLQGSHFLLDALEKLHDAGQCFRRRGRWDALLVEDRVPAKAGGTHELRAAGLNRSI